VVTVTASYTPEFAASLGWCPACYADGGRLVPAVLSAGACMRHLRVLPSRPVAAGQLALVDVAPVPQARRVRHATGEQELCWACVRAGVPQPRQGLSERTPGDATPLCLTCWRSRQDRARRRAGRLSPEQAGWIADLTVRLACEVCGSSQGGGDCWRCGDQVTWLAAARAVHEYDQALPAREAQRADELAGAHQVALARVRRAERRLKTVVDWRERVARVVAALPRLTKTGSRGQLRVAERAGSWARAWALLADFLARDAAERAARGLGGLGRPPQYPWAVAVMAVAASCESGRGAMPGLAWTALFADVAERTVTTGWARAVLLECAERIEKGRVLTVEERRELKRHRQRAVYDFTALHRSPVDAEPYLGVAAAMLAQLLQRATLLVEEHEAVVAAAVSEAAAVEAELLDVRAWLAEQRRDDLVLQASVDPVWAPQAQQATESAVLARGQANRAAAPPVDVATRVAVAQAAEIAAVEAVDNAFERARRIQSFCDHPRRGSGQRFTSCLSVGFKNPAQSRSPLAGRQRPDGRGADQKLLGASRSPTKRVPSPTASSRPRMAKGEKSSSQTILRRSEDMVWAKSLARDLAERWEFLGRYLADADDGRRTPREVARERGLRLRQIADTLRKQLSASWTAAGVVQLVERYAGILSVIAPGDAHSPLRYLKRMLTRALTNPQAIVRWPSPVREAYEREALTVKLATDTAAHAQLQAELDARAAAAAGATGAGLAALKAEMVRIAAARRAAPLGHAGVRWPRGGLSAERDVIRQSSAELRGSVSVRRS